jgi:hypothetical protein
MIQIEKILIIDKTKAVEFDEISRLQLLSFVFPVIDADFRIRIQKAILHFKIGSLQIRIMADDPGPGICRDPESFADMERVFFRFLSFLVDKYRPFEILGFIGDRILPHLQFLGLGPVAEMPAAFQRDVITAPIGIDADPFKRDFFLL